MDKEMLEMTKFEDLSVTTGDVAKDGVYVEKTSGTEEAPQAPVGKMSLAVEEALEDAERTISLKPDWGKGYFRKGMALASLGNMEEALITYFQCLVLEESCSKALRTEIYKVLHKLVLASKESSVESESGEPQQKSSPQASIVSITTLYQPRLT